MLVFLRSRLAARLAALFLLASLTPILGAALLLPRVFERSTRADAERRQRLLAERCAALVEEYVERAHAKLRTVARILPEVLASPGARAGLAEDAPRDALVERLQGLVDPPDAFLELQYFTGAAEPQFVSQVRQQELEAVQRLQPDYSERNRSQLFSNMAAELVQKPLRERAAWRSRQLQSTEGRVTLTLSVPVEAPGGEAGALAAYVDFAPLAESLQALAGGEYALRVGDTAGTTLADTGALAEETLGLELTLGDWSVSVREPAAGLEERLAAFRRQTWLWVALAAAIALALSLSLSAWITRPIGRLRRAADELARGNLQARAGLARRDEIGALAGAFDRMAAALGELDQAKSDFVAHVSHELRTPLTSMKLSVANLLDGVVGELDARQRTALERVERELERLIALVNRLLELARLEAGALRPTLEPVELLPLAREVAGSLAALAEERGVALEISGEGTVRADRGMLQRVLLNLVDNALKFSPRGTRVRVELGGRGLRVRDQGPGLGPALVFQAFRPGAQPGVPHAGAGLGLAIVKKLIELQGGSVRAENAPGGGALLTVELPEVQ